MPTVGRPTRIAMFWFFFNIALDLATRSTQKALYAAEELEKPAASPVAQRYRTGAVVLFLLTSALLVCAAIAFTVAPQNVIHEILGWTGIVCLHLCVLCGLRYSTVNRRALRAAKRAVHILDQGKSA